MVFTKKMKRFKSKFLTKFFEIIYGKLSSSKKKKQQVDVEEEYDFYADDYARFLEYKEWKRNKDLKKRTAPNVNVKRKFKVLFSTSYLSLVSEVEKSSVIPINEECKFKDLNYKWVYELAAKQNAYVMIKDEFDNVYLRINPKGKNIDESPESKKVIGHPLTNDFVE